MDNIHKKYFVVRKKKGRGKKKMFNRNNSELKLIVH